MSIVTSITGVFSELTTWLISAIDDATALFWDPQNGLTIIGTLAIMSLGIAVTLMVLAMIRRFLRFK